MQNCLDINLSEYILQHLPHQRIGFYLQENQPWEMAFIHSWKSAGHGVLVGVPHSTVRYWDLRYFFDPRSYLRTGKYDLPLPDKVGLNGQAALSAYKGGGYPPDQIVEVEALRYEYLIDVLSLAKNNNKPDTPFVDVLILGDYMPVVTHKQMQWLNDAAQLLPKNIRFTVKPHPNCPVDGSLYPELELHIIHDSLAEILCEYDVAFTSNITSAAVDAYYAGIPVISMLDGETLNMSPLRGIEDVLYVTCSRELVTGLKKFQISKKPVTKAYFCLDKNLPRWRKLMKL